MPVENTGIFGPVSSQSNCAIHLNSCLPYKKKQTYLEDSKLYFHIYFIVVDKNTTCSALRPIDRYDDISNHVITLVKFQKDKRYRDNVMKEIIATICAMLNTNGGKVMIRFDPNIPVFGSTFFHASWVIQRVEQYMRVIMGLNQTVSKIKIQENKESIFIVITKSDSLITTNYNLYLPSQKQVARVNPSEQLEKVMNNIINRKIVEEPVQCYSHYKEFVKGKRCGFYESKITQLSYLKAEQFNRTRLADRMIREGNKFSCYVSAFANYRGGHMYYGIRDDGVVAGEKISNYDISDIITKVEKAINKMIWPERIGGQPKRGEHWEIFFEPVLDENSKPIPSTFVIVIYIAPCLGGVFTEEPECYEMVEGKVQRMSITTWKKCIIQPVETKSESHNVKMLEKVKSYFRKGKVVKGLAYLKEHKEIQIQVQDTLFFEVMGCYLEAALTGANGDLNALKVILIKVLSVAKLLEPGVVTASIYTFAAAVTDLINLKNVTKHSPDILSTRALEHLQHATVSPSEICREVIEDMERKVHLALAIFYLGCNISGQHQQDKIDSSRLEKAKVYISAIEKSIDEGHPLSTYLDT